jgi:MoaA/NifB/PqqE/SkfB family radical SAM enzyme
MHTATKTDEHLLRAKARIEDLWLRGTDYDQVVVLDAMKSNRMLHLDIDLTDECELGCFYCDRTPDRYAGSRREKLTTEVRKRLILEAKSLGATTVEYPGAGEPMEDPSFWELTEFVSANGLIPVVFTAGHKLDCSGIIRLFDLGASVYLKYSILPPTLNDKYVRKPGYTEHARQVLEKMIRIGFNKSVPTRIAIDMIVTRKHHLKDIGDAHRWCRNNNVHSYISYLIPEGRSDNIARQCEASRSDKLLDYIAGIDREEFGLAYTPRRPIAGGYLCRQVNVGLFVNIYGQVFDCNGLGRPLHNIFDMSLSEIWNSSLAQRIRKREQQGYCVVRERVWDGTEERGFDRKVDIYTADEIASIRPKGTPIKDGDK